MRKSGDDIERELPGLLEIVRTPEIGTDETIRFIIGVSFTANQNCFDYWVHRVLRPQDGSHLRTRTEKEAIDSNHPYITFTYPPDPQVTGDVIRGILLARIETRVHSNDLNAGEDNQGLGRFRDALIAGYRTFRQEL